MNKFHAKHAFAIVYSVCARARARARTGNADLLYSSGAGEVEAVLLLGLPMTDDQQIVLV